MIPGVKIKNEPSKQHASVAKTNRVEGSWESSEPPLGRS